MLFAGVHLLFASLLAIHTISELHSVKLEDIIMLVMCG